MKKEEILKKWANLILACKSYYIDSSPTGWTDSVYDSLEERAIREDQFYVRDYVFKTYLEGTKTMNRYIDKIKKIKVESSTMIDFIRNQCKLINEDLYCLLKYDGASLAIYIDPMTGTPLRIVTVGNLKIDNFGVDQTSKLMKFLPNKFPIGIRAIQAEAVVDIDLLSNDEDSDKVRQRANGLITSKYREAEVNKYLTLRAFRYFVDDSMPEGSNILSSDFRDVLYSFETIKAKDGRILFSPAQIWKTSELSKLEITESNKTRTNTGYFLNDGWVIYKSTGECISALKYVKSGGNTESPKSIVKGIQWNNQVTKGKDGWSANVLIEPVKIMGSTVRKPSAGSVNKLFNNKVSKGAIVGIILANSTIPKVGETFQPGDENYEWPICSCGYQMSEKDTFGLNLKCSNVECIERLNRMTEYVNSLNNVRFISLDRLLVIDRFKWSNESIDISKLLLSVEENNPKSYYEYLLSFLRTDLQKAILDIVWRPSYKVLRTFYENNINN